MHENAAAVVFDISDNQGRVVALVEAGEPVDEVLRRAVAETTGRSGELLVLQLADDPSIIRRALAKAVLARDVKWWSQSLPGITAAVGNLSEEAFTRAAQELDDAACVVIDPSLLASQRPLAAFGRRLLGVPEP